MKLRGPAKRNPFRSIRKSKEPLPLRRLRSLFVTSNALVHNSWYRPVPFFRLCSLHNTKASRICYPQSKKMKISILVRLLCDAGSTLRARIAGRQKFSSAGQTIAATTNSPQSIYLPDQMSSALTGVHCANLFRGFMHMNRATA